MRYYFTVDFIGRLRNYICRNLSQVHYFDEFTCNILHKPQKKLLFVILPQERLKSSPQQIRCNIRLDKDSPMASECELDN